MRRQRFDWSIAGCVYGLSSECLEVSASVNHSRFHLSCSICVRIWCVMQDLCCLSPYPPTLWCICVLKRILLPLSLECRSQACATLLDLCRSFCWRFPPVPFGSWSLTLLFISLLFTPRPFILSVWGNSLHSPSLHWELWWLRCGFQTPAFCLFLLIILSNDNWLASLSISKACLEVFGPKVLGCSKTYVRVTSELPNSFWLLLFIVLSRVSLRAVILW